MWLYLILWCLSLVVLVWAGLGWFGLVWAGVPGDGVEWMGVQKKGSLILLDLILLIILEKYLWSIWSLFCSSVLIISPGSTVAYILWVLLKKFLVIPSLKYARKSDAVAKEYTLPLINIRLLFWGSERMKEEYEVIILKDLCHYCREKKDCNYFPAETIGGKFKLIPICEECYKLIHGEKL